MRILHVFRAPVGGLFRHVRDLARGQAALGHEVGIVCDSSTGGAMAEALLEAARSRCALGVHRIAISRLPGVGDIAAVVKVRGLAARLEADIIHGHGAKGGLYGRLAGRLAGIPVVYSPHGGSLHYDWSNPAGFAFLATEWALARIGSGAVFVCRYEMEAFARKIGLRGMACKVVHNGLWPEEFGQTPAAEDASDFVFIGEMRQIKGVDILIEALALIAQRRPVSATLVGDGPDLERYRSLAKARGLEAAIAFPGRLPTAQALRCGRSLVLPSRSESFPYVVLEAAAAAKPVIASAVGGIPEVLPSQNLVPPGDAIRLAARLMEDLNDLPRARDAASALSNLVARQFNAQDMAAAITEFYSSLDRPAQMNTHR